MLYKYVEIYVEDTGYGISKEDKNKLFKLFGKLKQKNGLNKQGIGLGLNICKQICELCEGDIDVDSEIGVGSKFFFKFLLSETPMLGEEIPFVDRSNSNNEKAPEVELDGMNIDLDEST
jgi:K+-sensing histidine kinase KdpD